MNEWLLILPLLAGLFFTSTCFLLAADADEEHDLIQILQSTTVGPREKDAACARLKFVGTSRSVPALAALLTDEQLSHSARYALEPMLVPEAGRALLEALDKTKSALRAGIINSLAVRGEVDAVPPLTRLLQDSDSDTCVASARALGQIGGPDATTALRACARNSAPALHDAAVDALLRCANRMLALGRSSAALAIFEQLDAPAEKDAVRVAAFRGRVGGSGNAGLNLVLHAIAGPPSPSQLAALQLARALQVPHTTRELARLLPDLKSEMQSALIGALAQRGDVTAVPALKALAGTSSPDTWVPIIRALDELGDVSVVSLLAGWAASGLPEVQPAARQALADLHHGNITQALVEQLGTSTPQVQTELARALGARGDKAAVPRLVELAQHGSGPSRRGVLQALSILADESQMVALVELVLQAKDEPSRTGAAEAVNAAYQHIQAHLGHADSSALVQGLEKGSSEARAALLPVCGGLVDPKVRALLRNSLNDQNPLVHSAAVRALCDTLDGELLPDLLHLAQSTGEDSVRTLAIGGTVRLVTQEDTVKLSSNQKVAALKSVLASASTPEQKRKVLAGLGEVADVESLRLVETTLDDQAVRNEAARAAVKVAGGLPANQALTCAVTLKKALAAAQDEGTRQAVQAALKQIQDNSDYLTNWEVAGPYQQAQKDYSALFDIPFPPETKDAQAIQWRALPAGSDPKRPWVMDLLKALGGQECVAYARTWIHCDQQQGATLEFGSDDGVKIWLNDNQVYALNVARALQPGSDKVNVTLRPGWNPLLFKITQNNQGWEFCARIRNPDGSHLDGLRCEAAPMTASK